MAKAIFSKLFSTRQEATLIEQLFTTLSLATPLGRTPIVQLRRNALSVDKSRALSLAEWDQTSLGQQ